MFAGFFEVLLAYRRARQTFDGPSAGVGQDRRMFQRVTVKASCRLLNPVFGLESLGTTIDVSLDGMGVAAPVNWAQGNRIRVGLDDAGFEAAGVIVFRKEEAPNFRYGVRFEQTGILQILKLRRFLKKITAGD